ncbi:hypothetical protein [Nocardia sp. NPDC004711]
MKSKQILVTAVCAAAVLAADTGTGHSAPAHEDGTVGYSVTVTDTALQIQTDAGSLHDDNGKFTIEAPDHTVLAGAELSFRVDDFVFPIAARIHDLSATLTPQFDLAHAVYQPVALPYEDQAPWKNSYDREQAAWNRLTSTLAVGATLATIVGGVGGGAVGCVLGGIAGAGVAAATIAGLFGPFVPAAAIGCLGGIAAIGAIGTFAGLLLIAAPIAILAGVQYFTTINSPLTPAK